ncbi:uncharacterized protein LOC114841087 [Diachasma alloeum]|uniref:Ionotropic receptor 128 n=1 Tax=Diachasma alloeum TaxID=454923 RepID=A0A4E0RQ93_9HYME|nr:uncharacterized protein LOC114841087 [Diachasma alloeum]THK32944.1 ionotropic receptor 128 [Diachasma alloeum]
MFITKTFLVIFFITILSNEFQSRPEIDWFESAYPHLSDSDSPHTALIIHYKGAHDADAIRDELFEKIIQTMPSASIEMNDEGIALKEFDFGNVSKLSTSLLFIFHTEYSGDNVQISRVMHSLNKLADFSVNCYLLIILRTSSNLNRRLEDILHKAWKKTIMNIAIVEIRGINCNRLTKLSTDNQQFHDCEGKKYSAFSRIYDDSPKRVIIHQFNPFINTFYHKKFSTRRKLFPNFANNMHGHDLKVRIINQPPFAAVTWNENNEMKKMSGPNIVLMQTITAKLNATPVILPNPKSMEFWLSNFTVEDLINESLNSDLTAHLCVRFTGHILEESVRSRHIITHELGVLMPKERGINKITLYYAIESTALILVIMLTIWFAAILLKFDKKFFELSRIFRLILSIGVDYQPTRSSQRVLFLVVIMIGFMYSNNIYASLTNLGVDPLVEKEYKTFEDIDNSGLIPIIRAPVFRKTFNDAVGAKLNLKKKSIQVIDSSNCLRMAMVHRNVCCVLFRAEAELYERLSHRKDSQYQLKLSEPIFWASDAAFRFRQGLPGKKTINEVIDRCNEAGLINKWYWNMEGSADPNNNTNDDLHAQDNAVQTQLLIQLIVVIAFGHLLATLVFIGELLAHRFKNSSKGKRKVRFCVY